MPSGYEIKRVAVGGLRLLVTQTLPRLRAAGKKPRAALLTPSRGVRSLPHRAMRNLDGVRFFKGATSRAGSIPPLAVGIIEADRVVTSLSMTGWWVALKKRMNQLSCC